MSKVILVNLIMFYGWAIAEDVPAALPPKADAIVKASTKKLSDLQIQINKVYIEELAQLEKIKIEVAKTGDLDGANSIATKIKEVKALIVDPTGKNPQDAAIANAEPIIGKWGDGNNVRWEFEADGIGHNGKKTFTFRWEKDASKPGVYNMSGLPGPDRTFTIKSAKLGIEFVAKDNATISLWRMAK